MEELRRVKRTQVFKHARIMAGSFTGAIDCVVCDITNLGAGLRVSPTIPVPDNFDLIFDSALFARNCKVRWRSGQRLGVSFAQLS